MATFGAEHRMADRVYLGVTVCAVDGQVHPDPRQGRTPYRNQTLGFGRVMVTEWTSSRLDASSLQTATITFLVLFMSGEPASRTVILETL